MKNGEVMKDIFINGEDVSHIYKNGELIFIKNKVVEEMPPCFGILSYIDEADDVEKRYSDR